MGQESGINLGGFSSGFLTRWLSSLLGRQSSQVSAVAGGSAAKLTGYWPTSVPCWLWQEASVLCHMVISIVLLLTWQVAAPRVSGERQRQRLFAVTVF